ncbi:hypothetical protein PsorP6_009975 [Peronosclerospora sorghi]|uniref:Uncharacterized protein n=1 Tax=Peronosclerospora sorghi TaxID=230839 RepID=A0ACC0VUT5_9STRA|nr:hypothetical protein PsorP6_009975 [Peronosclerospora sorghi]
MTTILKTLPLSDTNRAIFHKIFTTSLNWRQLYDPKFLSVFVETLGIRLCGPFDLLVAENLKIVATDKPLYFHGRYYFDPPEVATLLSDSNSDHGQHWGYFSSRAEEQIKKTTIDFGKDQNRRGNSAISGKTAGEKKKETVAASLHQLGIVVPGDTRTGTGYRELPITRKDLANLLHQLKRDVEKQSVARNRLSELVTRATIASDECDFGTSILLGLDVFTASSCLEKEALQLLRVSYMLLRRADFYKIVSGNCTHHKGGDAGVCINSIVSSTTNALRADKLSKHVTRAVLLPPMFPTNERSKQPYEKSNVFVVIVAKTTSNLEYEEEESSDGDEEDEAPAGSTASSSVFAPACACCSILCNGRNGCFGLICLVVQWTEDYDLLSNRLDAGGTGEGKETEEEFEALLIL